MGDCVNTLKGWTGKATVTIIFDSTVDEFTNNGIFEGIKANENVAIVAFRLMGECLAGSTRPQ